MRFKVELNMREEAVGRDNEVLGTVESIILRNPVSYIVGNGKSSTTVTREDLRLDLLHRRDVNTKFVRGNVVYWENKKSVVEVVYIDGSGEVRYAIKPVGTGELISPVKEGELS